MTYELHFFAYYRGLNGPYNDENSIKNKESIDKLCLLTLTSILGSDLGDVR